MVKWGTAEKIMTVVHEPQYIATSVLMSNTIVSLAMVNFENKNYENAFLTVSPEFAECWPFAPHLCSVRCELGTH